MYNIVIYISKFGVVHCKSIIISQMQEVEIPIWTVKKEAFNSVKKVMDHILGIHYYKKRGYLLKIQLFSHS